MPFVRGLELARRFFADIVEPVINHELPNLHYAAALIGYGSEVIGFDTPMSSDHNWGPRLQIFLRTSDVAEQSVVASVLLSGLPDRFEGWTVSFGVRNCQAHAAEAPGFCQASHGITIQTLGEWTQEALAIDAVAPLCNDDWIGIPEHALLEVTAGAVFRDDIGELTSLRERLTFYPQDIWLYRLASQWERIDEVQAFVGRSGAVGDDLGSRIIAARLVRDVMRIGFLLERRYAPYPKWFGSGFARLPCAATFAESISQALAAADWQAREAALIACYRTAAELHINRQVPGKFAPLVHQYFDRPFTVINANEIARAIRAEISETRIKLLPNSGTVDQLSDSAAILDDPQQARVLGEALRRRQS